MPSAIDPSASHSSLASLTQEGGTRPKAALFVTCLVEFMRPTVGLAAAQLISQHPLELIVPEAQSCCGLPLYNAGDVEGTRILARQTLACLTGYDVIIVPSSSCAAMLRCHYPRLFQDDPITWPIARLCAARTYELSDYLSTIHKAAPQTAPTPIDTPKQSDLALHRASEPTPGYSYHLSCSARRELGIKHPPYALLEEKIGQPLKRVSPAQDPNSRAEQCCGFGGSFCVKYPEISTQMADVKLQDFQASGNPRVIGSDLGCLLHLAGRAAYQGQKLEFWHIAEILAGWHTLIPALGAHLEEPQK
jgi:L-lactate dehydrogenase complex protein LldE